MMFVLVLLAFACFSRAEPDNPSLAAKPWRIGVAPAHITTPPAELFDRPQDWSSVASSIQIFKYYGVQLQQHTWATTMPPKALAEFSNQHHVALACEFGSFSYGKERPAQGAFRHAVTELQPIFDAGGTVSYISLDGPDARLLKGKSKRDDAPDLPHLAEEIALFYKLVREKYPGIKIGIICNYPNWDFDDKHFGSLGGDTRATGVTTQAWFDALRTELEKQNDRIDYVEIDNPWGYFIATQTHKDKKPMNGAANLLAVQNYCLKYNIPFWLVVNSEPKGPDAFEVNTLSYISQIRQAGIYPDVFMIQSWYKQPAQTLPQSEAGTFMHAADKIIHLIQELYPTPSPTSTPISTVSPASTPIGPVCAVHTPEPFPASKYWPDKIRALIPLSLKGVVGGGTITSTVAAGTLLPAELSSDHKTVIVHNLDLSESVPIEKTDFLERARKKMMDGH